MFFDILGRQVLRHWRAVLAFWFVLLVCASGIMAGWANSLNLFPFQIPGWRDVAKDGEFAFLPKDMPSLRAEELFEKAFPEDILSSSAVVVVRHTSGGIDDNDREFIRDVLTPKLEELITPTNMIVTKVRNYTDTQIGQMLNSEDGLASLVMVEFNTEFLEHKNRPVVTKIEALIDREHSELRDKIPPGVSLSLSGSATVGRDMLEAQDMGSRSTEKWTILLVVFLLIGIYRAPFLAVIPLISVFVAVHISLALIVLATHAGWFGLHPFNGLKTYITVVVYGAGVDYCLFLVARYKEELDRGLSLDDALLMSYSKVGAALTASAGTVMCGIGMMYFALFGKFQQAGIGMSFSLGLMLLAALTFTPAILKLAGRHAFWPQRFPDTNSRPSGWIASASLLDRILAQVQLHRIWEWVADAVGKRPGLIWIGCMAMMIPFAAIGVMFQGHLSYGLLSELPSSKTSVKGANAVREHFAAGNTGPLTILIQNDQVDLLDPDGIEALESLTDKILEKKDELGIADVRSVSLPMGLNDKRKPLQKLAARGVARKYYICHEAGLEGHVSRLDLISKNDPFSRDSIKQLESVQKVIPELLPDYLKNGSKLYYYGTPASIRDLKTVTDRDQWVIDSLVLGVVFMILVVLLRKVATSGYLILSVFFSYFVTLGFTYAVFWLVLPDFAGLDWKVPMFLFTILIAVGEDYNIFLMARIEEDQHEFGPVEGVRTALLQTGSIISSCGIIMAGTFFSLVIAGSLLGMQQLGFALTCGVLLDTFVVRPVLVPAYMIMLESGYFGPLGKILGKHPGVAKSVTDA